MSNIAVASKVRNLGVIFDAGMSFGDHISSICSASSYHLRNIGLIRKYLTQDAAEQLVHAFVTSRLDMGNSLLYGLPNNQIYRLSRLQHIAARIITKTKPREHITPVLKKLHWLPVPQRIIFKILTYAYRSHTGSSPSYLSGILHPYTPARQLRSQNKRLLLTKKIKRSWGNRSFASAAPVLWNNLPEHIKCSPSLLSFKCALKTHLMIHV